MAVEGFVHKLVQLSSNDLRRASKIIDRAIINGWKGIYPLHGYAHSKNTPSLLGTLQNNPVKNPTKLKDPSVMGVTDFSFHLKLSEKDTRQLAGDFFTKDIRQASIRVVQKVVGKGDLQEYIFINE